MTEWRDCKFGEIATFSYGKMPNKKNIVNCGYPIFSGYKIVGYYNSYMYEDPQLIIVARGVGGTGDVKISPPKSYITNLSIIAEVHPGKANKKFLYYYFKINNLRELDSGSAQSQITINDLNNYCITLPPLPEQKAIADVLSSLDDKIDLLTKQNKTLEDLAQAYFRKWFIEDASDEWEVGKLGDYIEIHDSKRVPLSKIEREKMKSGTLYPYYGAATIMDYVNDYIFDGEYILMGEDGTVETEDGYPVLQYATGKFWVNNHAHVLTAKSPFNNYFIWFFLKQCNISGIVTGAVQPKINQENLKNIDIPIPDLTLINSANQFFANIFAKILNNLEQIKTFQKLRDTLLPKLISGEIRLKM